MVLLVLQTALPLLRSIILTASGVGDAGVTALVRKNAEGLFSDLTLKFVSA